MSPVDGGSRWQAANLPLAETVAALGKEVRDLRASARMRAVIEQAKGVLVERHGITLDEAFSRLRTMSQEHNVRLVEVAATVVGVAIPETDAQMANFGDHMIREELPASHATSDTWKALRSQPDVRAGVVTAMLDAVAGATSRGDEAAQLLLDILAPQEVAAVTMYRTGADGSLRFVGQVGVPGDLVSSWRSIPPSTDIPFVRSVVDNQALFWGDRASRIAEFPAVARSGSAGFEATATIPVVDEGLVIGVVGLIWNSERVFDELRRKAITKEVQRVAPLLMRNMAASDPELEWLNTLLRLHLDPWLLLETVSSSDRMVRDFVVQDASTAVVDASDWLGRRLLEIWPFMAEDGTGDALGGLVKTGGSWSTTVAEASEAPWGQKGALVRAVRLSQRVVIVWKPGPGAVGS